MEILAALASLVLNSQVLSKACKVAGGCGLVAAQGIALMMASDW
jgi:hypothetical protein